MLFKSPKTSIFIIIIMRNDCLWFVVHLFYVDWLAVRGWYYNLCRQRVALPRLKRLRCLEFGVVGDRCVYVVSHNVLCCGWYEEDSVYRTFTCIILCLVEDEGKCIRETQIQAFQEQRVLYCKRYWHRQRQMQRWVRFFNEVICVRVMLGTCGIVNLIWPSFKLLRLT